CGWIDLVALKYAIRINGLTGLVLTKLDVLTGMSEIGVAVRYSGPEGATFEEFPYHQSMVHKARAEYEMLPGWDEDIGAARSLDELPKAARDYLDYVADFLGVPIVLAGVGPARDQIIWTASAPERFAEPERAGA
ncbi:MAG: adenylosuccinate synthase, partial [Thermoleophilaceae bacterium]|nr:adenylosuccinate synthase [Thermoleophilaceae bacterium]